MPRYRPARAGGEGTTRGRRHDDGARDRALLASREALGAGQSVPDGVCDQRADAWDLRRRSGPAPADARDGAELREQQSRAPRADPSNPGNEVDRGNDRGSAASSGPRLRAMTLRPDCQSQDPCAESATSVDLSTVTPRSPISRSAPRTPASLILPSSSVGPSTSRYNRWSEARYASNCDHSRRLPIDQWRSKRTSARCRCGRLRGSHLPRVARSVRSLLAPRASRGYQTGLRRRQRLSSHRARPDQRDPRFATRKSHLRAEFATMKSRRGIQAWWLSPEERKPR